MFGNAAQRITTFVHQMGMKNRGSLQILWVSMAKFNRSKNIFPRKIKNMRKKCAKVKKLCAKSAHFGEMANMRKICANMLTAYPPPCARPCEAHGLQHTPLHWDAAIPSSCGHISTDVPIEHSAQISFCCRPIVMGSLEILCVKDFDVKCMGCCLFKNILLH
jgi:hypothetical protein